MLNGLTIVLPCHNEEPNVDAAVAEALSAGAETAERIQVVLVDDGSTDGTGARAAALAARHPEVDVVTHETCRGYGSAMRSGIAAATEPWVFLTDADLQFDLAQLPGFAAAAELVDLVHGFRIERRDPAYRRLTAGAWNWLVRALFAIPVRDVDCAFKLARRELLVSLDLCSEGATFSTELVVKAQRAGARLQELGVEHRPRLAGAQSGNRPSVVARAFRELLVLRQATSVRPHTG
jgi:glycosyltransferase involved in cell wall biosynthesis